MKIQNNRSRKIIILLVSITIVIIGVGTYFGYASFKAKDGQAQTTKPVNTVDYSKPTSDQVDAGNTIKSNSSSSDANSGGDQTPIPAPIPGSNLKDVQVVITRVNQSGQSITVGAYIDALENSGQCTLTLTNSAGLKFTKTSTIQAQNSTSACADLTLNSISSGNWDITVSYLSNNLTGSTTNKNVIVN